MEAFLEIRENEFAEILISNQDRWHEFYYFSELDLDNTIVDDGLIYRIHRAGLDPKLPKIFYVKRSQGSKYSVLNFVCSGYGTVTFEGKEYDVKAGELFILPAGIPHSYSSDKKNPIAQIWIEIEGGDSKRILRSVTNHFGPILRGEVSQKIGAKMSLLLQRLTMREYYETSILLYQILLDLLFEKNKKADDIVLNKSSRLQIAISYIDSHLMKKIENKKLAMLCGLSLSYFMKLFAEIYHKTPQDYIMHQRIEIAKHLLTRTEKSVDNIAYQLGFCTTAHFIKRFSKQVGLTPAKYRKNASI